jgi:rhamnosyltransferase
MIKKISRPDVAVIVLTRNAGSLWPEWLAAIKQQTVQAGRYLVIDSSSSDKTVEQALKAGLEVYSIAAETFNHGGTRQMAAELCHGAEYLVFLTQDAILDQVNSLELLLKQFADPKVGMVYGRHVPHAQASLIEKHARNYTYPEVSAVRSKADLEAIGFRAAFSSDVYAGYRASALRSVGGFPEHIIVSEDSYVSARLLLAAWKVVYSADSAVRHSHQYSLLQIFRRYFDIGVFHASEATLLRGIGKPDKEAWVYVRSLINYLSKRRKRLLWLAALQTLVKLAGFKVGKAYRWLPAEWCYKLSLQKAYWQATPKSWEESWLYGTAGQALYSKTLSVPSSLLKPAVQRLATKPISAVS